MESSFVPEGPLTVRTTSALAVVVVGLAVVVVALAVVVVGLAVVVVGLAVVVVGFTVVEVAFTVVVAAFEVVVVSWALVLVERRDDEVEEAPAAVDVGGTEDELEADVPSEETGVVAAGCVDTATEVEDSAASPSPPQAPKPTATMTRRNRTRAICTALIWKRILTFDLRFVAPVPLADGEKAM
jgi:hypothetical protein